MDTLFRDEQVSVLSKKLGLSKVAVTKVLTAYVGYLKAKLERGETIKFLNVCYLKVAGRGEDLHETLAYISTELSKELGLSPTVIFRVLTTYEECLILDLRKLYSYSIRGLLKIRLERNARGEYKVRTKKSTVYNNLDIYVTTTGYFKRRAEVV